MITLSNLRFRTKRIGFTLVELLVVITIIGILMTMVFPAIGSVMDLLDIRRCSSNQKQIVVALINKADSKRLPAGVITSETPKGVKGKPQYYNAYRKVAGFNKDKSLKAVSMGPTWMISILNQMDEGPLYEQITKCVPYANHVPSQCSYSEGSGGYPYADGLNPGASIPKKFKCPSAEEMDEDGFLSDYGYENIAKGNYAANFGTEFFVNNGKDIVRNKKAGAFAVEYNPPRDHSKLKSIASVEFPNLKTVMSASSPRYAGNWKMGASKALGVKINEIKNRDGLDKTIMISEILPVNNSADARGAWWFPGMGGSSFTAKTPPNAFDVNKAEYYDTLMVCDGPQVGNPLYCEKRTASDGNIPNTWAAARSAHPGLVVVCMASGNPFSISDTIDLEVWQALCSRAGNDNKIIGNLEDLE